MGKHRFDCVDVFEMCSQAAFFFSRNRVKNSIIVKYHCNLK